MGYIEQVQVQWQLVLFSHSHLYYYWGLKLAANLKSGTLIIKFNQLVEMFYLLYLAVQEIYILENNHKLQIQGECNWTPWINIIWHKGLL